MIGHSLACDEPTRWKVDLTSTASVLVASGWASWYRSIGKACVLLACEKRHKLPTRYLRLASMKQPLPWVWGYHLFPFQRQNSVSNPEEDGQIQE